MVKHRSLGDSLDPTEIGVCVIRDDRHRLAGFIRLDEFSTKALEDIAATKVYFIVLSTVSL